MRKKRAVQIMHRGQISGSKCKDHYFSHASTREQKDCKSKTFSSSVTDIFTKEGSHEGIFFKCSIKSLHFIILLHFLAHKTSHFYPDKEVT